MNAAEICTPIGLVAAALAATLTTWTLPAAACASSDVSTSIRYRVPESGNRYTSSYIRICVLAGDRPEVYVSWHWPDESQRREGYPLEPLIALGETAPTPWGMGAVALPRLGLYEDGTLRLSDPMRLQAKVEGARFRVPGANTRAAVEAALQRHARGGAEPVALVALRPERGLELPVTGRLTRDGVEFDTQGIDVDLPLHYLFDAKLRPVAYLMNAGSPRGQWNMEAGYAASSSRLTRIDYRGTRVDLTGDETGRVTGQQSMADDKVVMWRSELSHDAQGRLTSFQLFSRRRADSPAIEPRRQIEIRYQGTERAAIASLDYNGRTELHVGYDQAGDPAWLVAPGRCVVFFSKMSQGNGKYRLSLRQRLLDRNQGCLPTDEMSRDGWIHLRPRP